MEREQNTDPDKFNKGYGDQDYLHAKVQKNRDWTKDEEKDFYTRRAEYLQRLEIFKKKMGLQPLEGREGIKELGNTYTFQTGDTLYPALREKFLGMNEHTAFFVMARMLERGINVDLISAGDTLTIEKEDISSFGKLTFVHEGTQTIIESILDPKGSLPQMPDKSKVYASGESAPAGAQKSPKAETRKAPAPKKTSPPPAEPAKSTPDERKSAPTAPTEPEERTDRSSAAVDAAFEVAMDELGIGKELRTKFKADTDEATGYNYIRKPDDEITIWELDPTKSTFELLLLIRASDDPRFAKVPVIDRGEAPVFLTFNKQEKPGNVDKYIDNKQQKMAQVMYDLCATADALEKTPALQQWLSKTTNDDAYAFVWAYAFIDTRTSEKKEYSIELLKGKKITIHDKDKGTLIVTIDLTKTDQATPGFVTAKIDELKEKAAAAEERKRQAAERKQRAAEALRKAQEDREEKRRQAQAEKTRKAEEKEIAALKAEEKRDAEVKEKREAAEKITRDRAEAEQLRQAEKTRVQESFQARKKELIDAVPRDIRFEVDPAKLTIKWHGEELAKVSIDPKDPTQDYRVEGKIRGPFKDPHAFFSQLAETIVYPKLKKEIFQAIGKIPTIAAGDVETHEGVGDTIEIKIKAKGDVIATLTSYKLNDVPQLVFKKPTLDGSDAWTDPPAQLNYKTSEGLEKLLKSLFPSSKEKLDKRKKELESLAADKESKNYSYNEKQNGDFVDFIISAGTASVGTVKVWKKNPSFMIVTDTMGRDAGTVATIGDLKSILDELPRAEIDGSAVDLFNKNDAK